MNLDDFNDGPDAVGGRLFEPLTSTEATGIGVGPPISKSIIEAVYRRIGAESNSRVGTSFALPLPTAESEE